MTALSNRLNELKISKTLLQKDIASAVGLSLRAYQYYERGEREPDATTLLNIATFFDVSVDYLLGRTDNPEVNK